MLWKMAVLPWFNAIPGLRLPEGQKRITCPWSESTLSPSCYMGTTRRVLLMMIHILTRNIFQFTFIKLISRRSRRCNSSHKSLGSSSHGNSSRTGSSQSRPCFTSSPTRGSTSPAQGLSHDDHRALICFRDISLYNDPQMLEVVDKDHGDA